MLHEARLVEMGYSRPQHGALGVASRRALKKPHRAELLLLLKKYMRKNASKTSKDNLLVAVEFLLSKTALSNVYRLLRNLNGDKNKAA